LFFEIARPYLDEFGIESEVIGKIKYEWQHFITVRWQNVTDTVHTGLKYACMYVQLQFYNS